MPLAEFVLGKRRILEIYLNVVEWGPGMYGGESAGCMGRRRYDWLTPGNAWYTHQR